MNVSRGGGPHVLVSAGNVEDGEQVGRELKTSFSQVTVSADPNRAVADFEDARPDVLVLAFPGIAKAQTHCLGLYRHGQSVHAHPHGTVLLCSKDEVQAAYELCRKDCFDDYVMYWPHAYDRWRLPMSVWIAWRDLSTRRPPVVPRTEFLAHARNLDELEATLDRHLEQGERQAPLRTWTRGLRDEIAPKLAATRALAEKVLQQRLVLMVVEDDEVTRRLIRLVLDDVRYEIHFAVDAPSALNLLRRHQPDAILMDIRLPGIDGVSLTERLKASPSLAQIPILIVSGDSRASTLARIREVGADGFVVKPFTRESLSTRLDRIFARQAPSAVSYL